MVNDFPIQYPHDEMERNAYNAAFYGLGLRWYWDHETYTRLTRFSPHPAKRVRHYLETEQSHLLRAYDVAFLVDAIEEKKAEHRRRGTEPSPTGHFDWAQAAAGQVGA
jgi:hypothetical protein